MGATNTPAATAQSRHTNFAHPVSQTPATASGHLKKAQKSVAHSPKWGIDGAWRHCYAGQLEKNEKRSGKNVTTCRSGFLLSRSDSTHQPSTLTNADEPHANTDLLNMKNIPAKELTFFSIIILITGFIASTIFFSIPASSFIEGLVVDTVLDEASESIREYRDIKAWALALPIAAIAFIWWDDKVSKLTAFVLFLFLAYCIIKPWIDYFVGGMIFNTELEFSWIKYIILLIMAFFSMMCAAAINPSTK